MIRDDRQFRLPIAFCGGLSMFDGWLALGGLVSNAHISDFEGDASADIILVSAHTIFRSSNGLIGE